MGNTASTDKVSSNSGSPRDTTHATNDSKDPHALKKLPRRRESVPALPHGRAAPAPPSASLESAHGRWTPPSTLTQQRSHSSPHRRERSQTSATPRSNYSHDVIQEGPDPTSKSANASDAHAVNVPSHPVPTHPNVQPRSAPRSFHSPTSPSSYHVPNSQFQRPPRLPLPIEQEDFAPGSPILGPTDSPGPLGDDPVPEDDATQLERKASVLSGTTVDDDEDADDFAAHGRATGQMVDTLVEWKEGGERVYVTGSFSGWTKKHRLHRHGPSRDPNALSAIIPLLVGAHHMTFLVDGQMRTSRHLPTAVDYTNVLINYVEVSADDISRPSQPVDIHRSPHEQTHRRQPLAIETHRPPTDGRTTPAPPPLTPDLLPTQRAEPPSAIGSGIVSRGPPDDHEAQRPTSKPGSMAALHPQKRTIIDNKKYHAEIPEFLQDLDAPEQSHRFARASAVMGTQPTPPALPMFLNKSILNGTLPMKDDASVLVMPNHTVLNHLATTSIKAQVLATSSTTRYKRKYVTTIMHRPTSEQAA